MGAAKVSSFTLLLWNVLSGFSISNNGVQGLLCCKQYGNETDCASGTSCSSGELCYHEVVLTDTGTKLHQLGCRSSQLCAGAVPVGKRGSANVLCSKCCDNAFCNIPQCQTDPCIRNNPCMHGQCLTNIDGQTECSCDIGFTGTHCDQQEVCHPNPCVHGTCSRTTSGFVCTCNHGYAGSRCDKVDPCANNHLCLHGTCFVDANGQAKCNCDIGYGGHNCELEDVCHPNPCKHGVCKPSTSGYACTCNHGFTGNNCDKDDPCAQNPCQNGVCSTSATGWHCTCDAGFNGRYCDIDIDECASSPCSHGVCFDHINNYTCKCFTGYDGKNCDHSTGIRDCKDVLDQMVPSITNNDIFSITIGTKKQNVRCDMITDGGGWTVLMNRESATQDFMLDSSHYARGFGNISANFWIGLEAMHILSTDGRQYQLRVDLTAANGTKFYEVYDNFRIGPQPNFTLHVGKAKGTAGDSLSRHNGYGFSTYDADRDDNQGGGSCSNYLKGAWWFHNCYDSCLTCSYVPYKGYKQCRSMSWNAIAYCQPLKAARMMIRPT